MNPVNARNGQAFDAYAAEYDAALAQGLAVSGEEKTYFIHSRITWLARCLQRLGERPRCVLDFGCGIGSTTPYFGELPGMESVIGVDISAESLTIANQAYGSSSNQFLKFNQYQPAEQLDLAFCNGVFHHIPIPERANAVDYICRSLRRGGLFAFWDNNPWSPGARYVMSQIPFDRGAIMVSAPEARRLLKAGGFDIVRTDFLFIFPRILSWFRGLEAILSPLPLGAQYQVLCRKR
jgi:SAM-dependent methyltransferase